MVVTGILVPVLALVILEIGLRAIDYGTESDFFVPIDGQRAYTANPNFARQFFPPSLARLPQPMRIQIPKPEDTTRILVLGGSAAMGEPDPAFSLSRVLDAMLVRRFPDRRFEIINAGMATMNSHVVRLIAAEAHKIEPDIALIYMGNNEVVGPYGAGTVFGRHSPSLGLIRAGISLRQFRVGQLVEQVVQSLAGRSQFVSEGQGMSLFRDQFVRSDDARLESVYSHFAANLDDIVDELTSAGVDIVLATVGSNTLNHAPFASVSGQDSKGDPLTWGKLYADGIGYLAAGDERNATTTFEMANGIDSTHAELRFRLGRLYLTSGDTVSAREHLVSARDLDALRFRADSRINREIRTASVRHDVPIVDIAQALESEDRSNVGLAGADLFYEHVHLNFRGTHLAAASLFAHLFPDAPIPDIDVCASDLAMTPFDAYRLHASVSGLMARAPFTNQYDYHQTRRRLNERETRLRLAGMGRQGVETSDQIYREALARRPDDLFIRQNYARFLQENGRLVEAASLWKELLDVVDAPSWRLAFSTALSDQGAHRAALTSYERLKEQMPGLVLPHIQIGYEYVATGQIGEAIHVLREALDMNPGSTIARLNLASLYDDAGEAAAADQTLEWGLELVRGRDDAHSEAEILSARAELEEGRGQLDEAAKSLEGARTLFEMTKDVSAEARVRLRLAKIQGLRADTAAAIETLDEGRKFAASFALTEAEAGFLVSRAMYEIREGRREEGKSMLREALARYRELSDLHPAIERLVALTRER